MKRIAVFFIVSFLIVASGAYWPLRMSCGGNMSRGDNGVAGDLRREAQLVEYFCLSRVPPVFGKSLIPAEWEKALGTTIRLRSGVGELASEEPKLTTMLNQIRALKAGESVYLAAGSRDVLVYRPAAFGDQLLFLAKSSGSNGVSGTTHTGCNPLLSAMLIGLVAAILLTVLGQTLLSKRQP
jgi:hypothetical protein